MHLREDGDGTVSEWTATAEMSGLIASLGQRALGPVTKRLVNQFYDCMEETISEGAGATSQLEAAEDPSL
jgi:carbon monoxide dehydrogenase subunit G